MEKTSSLKRTKMMTMMQMAIAVLLLLLLNA